MSGKCPAPMKSQPEVDSRTASGSTCPSIRERSMDMATYRRAGHKKNIVANDYDGWPEERRNSVRPHLQCPACRKPVHFRRKSRDGKDPCFAARHEDGCPMASSSHYIAAVAAAAIREVEQIVKDTSVLAVDLSLPDRDSRPAGAPNRIIDDAQVGSEGRASRRHTKNSGKPKKPSSVGGKQLLRYLVCSADFRQANIEIRIPGMNRGFTSSELFRPFSEITIPAGGKEGGWHGFWGRLAGSDVSMEHLNTSAQDTVCIIVDEAIRDRIYRRWKITRRNIASAYCLVFGKPMLSRRNNIYVKVSKEDRIVFWLVKETDVEDKLNEVHANAGASSFLDPGLQTLQAYSLDGLRKDDWT